MAFLLNSCAKKYLRIADYLLINNSNIKESLHVNLQIDKNNQIINFDIPKPTKNKNQQYVLEGIYLHFPDFQPFSSAFRGYSESLNFRSIDTVEYIPIFKNKIDINN